jgi:SAM-dependent methyltransferase
VTAVSLDLVGHAVRGFYKGMPFNYYSSAGAAAQQLRVNPLPSACPDLHALLASGKVRSVLDFGCGAGWLANTIARHYGIRALGVDFTEKAIARARLVSRRLKTSDLASFVAADLFEFEGTPADLVTCVGVLHHTRCALEAFDRIQRFVAPQKYVYLGLYHLYGRKPFLELFRDLIAREGEDAAFRRYVQLDSARRSNRVHRMSWFRDQVLHPHESSHTLREVAAWLAATSFEIERTSINGFEPFDDMDVLFDAEKHYEEISRRANFTEGRYFPGFFTVLARRTEHRPC